MNIFMLFPSCRSFKRRNSVKRTSPSMSAAWKKFASSEKSECAINAARTRAIVDGTEVVIDAADQFHVIVDIIDVKICAILFILLLSYMHNYANPKKNIREIFSSWFCKNFTSFIDDNFPNESYRRLIGLGLRGLS